LPTATKRKNRKDKPQKPTKTQPQTKERNHQTKTLKTQPKNTRKTDLQISLNASGMGERKKEREKGWKARQGKR